MAKDNTKTAVDVNASGKVMSADEIFNEILTKGGEKAQEIHVDKPIVDWDDLDDRKIPVCGYLVRADELNLPPGSKRPDGRTTWTAYVFHLTRPTRAVLSSGKGQKDIVDVEAGRQVYVAANPKNQKDLDAFLGRETMHEIVILATHKIETANNPMWSFRIAELGSTKKREGQFLKGGPGPAALPISMPNGVTDAERAAAKNEVPFS